MITQNLKIKFKSRIYLSIVRNYARSKLNLLRSLVTQTIERISWQGTGKLIFHGILDLSDFLSVV